MDPNPDSRTTSSYRYFPLLTIPEDFDSNGAFLYPLTPYPMLRGDWPSSSAEADRGSMSTTDRFVDSPSSSEAASSPFRPPPLRISSTELKNVLDSLINQVNWLEVALHVANNRPPSVYLEAVQQIIQAHISRLASSEEGRNAESVDRDSSEEIVDSLDKQGKRGAQDCDINCNANSSQCSDEGYKEDSDENMDENDDEHRENDGLSEKEADDSM